MFNLAGVFAKNRMFECNTIKSQDAGAWILKVLVVSIYPNVRFITYYVVVDADEVGSN